MPADPGVLIVGAGASGLALAAELAPHGPVTVADRLPAIGGVLGGEHPAIRTLAAVASGVTWLLATTVSRWRGDAALVAGPDGIRWLPARRLVYAGGSRPATRAELGIAGPRPAGILSAAAALPLLEAGVLLGRRVAVLPPPATRRCGCGSTRRAQPAAGRQPVDRACLRRPRSPTARSSCCARRGSRRATAPTPSTGSRACGGCCSTTTRSRSASSIPATAR